jgi:hypothetical protein
MRIISLLVYVLLLAVLTTAESTLPKLRGGHQVLRALQNHPYAFNTLPTNALPSAIHLEETTTSRKLVTQRRRRRKGRQPKWNAILETIPEDSELYKAVPSRNPKTNLPSTTFFWATQVSTPQKTRPPLQRQQIIGESKVNSQARFRIDTEIVSPPRFPYCIFCPTW